MKVMAAVRAEGAGCRLATVDLPDTLGADEVRVRMLYAPVNPADLLAIDGRYAFPLADGAVLGAAGVGEVVETGAAVDGLAPGDLVLPLDRGNWCAARVVGQARLLRVPAGTDPRRAALMRINPPTARLLLDAAGVGEGGRLVLNGARSSVAAWVRALAATRRIAVVNLVRGAVREDDPPPAWTDDAAMAPDLPWRAAAALDCVAGEATGRLAALLEEGGRLVVYGHLSGESCAVPSALLTGRGLSVHGFSLRRAEAALSAAASAAMWAELWQAADAVRPEGRIGEVLPLAAATGLRREGKGVVLLDLSAG